MSNEVLQTLLATYGAPLVLAVFLWWQSRGGKKEEPGQKYLTLLVI